MLEEIGVCSLRTLGKALDEWDLMEVIFFVKSKPKVDEILNFESNFFWLMHIYGERNVGHQPQKKIAGHLEIGNPTTLQKLVLEA
jgi:hypothetical protein